jgi:hypothetical protein
MATGERIGRARPSHAERCFLKARDRITFLGKNLRQKSFVGRVPLAIALSKEACLVFYIARFVAHSGSSTAQARQQRAVLTSLLGTDKKSVALVQSLFGDSLNNQVCAGVGRSALN